MAENQVALIEVIAVVNQEIVIVLATGSVVEMPWIDSVKGLIHGICLANWFGIHRQCNLGRNLSIGLSSRNLSI